MQPDGADDAVATAAGPAEADGAAPRAFRDALGTFATGVTVVSARTLQREGGPAGVGVTVNSFTSVSLDPPLVMWCIGKESQRYAAFRDAEGFAVSVLSAEQEAIARRFTLDPVIPAADPAFEAGPGGTLWLAAAVARFACRTVARHPGGDHLILVGRVLAFDGPREAPLLGYRRGGFVTIA